MPELPEVETLRRGLEELIVGKEISDVSFDWEKSFPNDTKLVNEFILGATIKEIDRRGKALLIHLDSGYSLNVHLRMTGQLVFRGEKSFGAGHPTDSLVARLPDKSTRVEIDFSDGSTLYFNDQRKFGYVKLIETKKIDEDSFFKRLGPEPLDYETTHIEFADRVKKRANTSIKAALLDQSTIAGVGNIYADEALFLAKIHPATLVKKLSKKKLNTLFDAIEDVLLAGIESGGATDRNYVDAEGNMGSYLNFAKVFRREGKPCEVCGNTIKKIKVAGRGTHFCHSCQKRTY